MAADIPSGGSGRSSSLANAVPWPLSAACADVRPAAQADSVAAATPRFVASPADAEQAGALLRAAAGLGLTVLPRGTGSRLHWGYPPARCDLVLDTARMDRV